MINEEERLLQPKKDWQSLIFEKQRQVEYKNYRLTSHLCEKIIKHEYEYDQDPTLAAKKGTVKKEEKTY